MLFALACAAREHTVRFDALAIVAEVPAHSTPRSCSLICLCAGTFSMFP